MTEPFADQSRRAAPSANLGFLWRAGAAVIEASPDFAAAFGRSDGRLDIEGLMDCLEADDSHAVVAAATAALDAGQSFDLRLRRADGGGDIRVRGGPLGREGRWTGIAGVLQPVARVAPLKALPVTPAAGRERLTTLIGSWEWDIAADRLIADEGFALAFGIAPEVARSMPGIETFAGAIHPDDERRVRNAVARTLSNGGDYEADYRVRGADGMLRHVLARGRVLLDEEGQPERLSGVLFDLTQLRELEQSLAESELRFHVIADNIDQMIWSTRPDGYHDYYNARWYEYTGVPLGSTDGEAWNGMFHPDDQERAWSTWRRSLATGEPYHIEYRLRHRSGEYRWVIGRAQCVRDGEGRIQRWYGTCTDIHDLKLAEEARETLMRELSHRIKNIFAVIISLVTLSAREMPASRDWSQRLRARIEALAHAHEHVRPHGPESADQGRSAGHVQSLIRSLLKAYELDRSRVQIEGCDAMLGPRAATALALLVHELATNAVKHGALSASEGRVFIACSKDDETFRLSWREEGGPRLEGEPQHRGFGSELSERVAQGQLRAVIDRRWNREGLELLLSVPSAILAG